MSAIEERVELENRIIKNKISKQQLKREVKLLEEKYGADAFLPYKLTKKEKPWNKTYYNELIMLGNAGACSKEFLFHIIEVRDYLKTRARIIGGIGVIAILGVLCGIYYWMN